MAQNHQGVERLVSEGYRANGSILGKEEARSMHQAVDCWYVELQIDDDSYHLLLVRHHQYFHVWTRSSHPHSYRCAHAHRPRYLNCQWWPSLQQKAWVKGEHSQHRRLDRVHSRVPKDRVSESKGTRHLSKYVAREIYLLRPIGTANQCLPCYSRTAGQRSKVPSWPISFEFYLTSYTKHPRSFYLVNPLATWEAHGGLSTCGWMSICINACNRISSPNNSHKILSRIMNLRMKNQQHAHPSILVRQ